MKTNLNFVGENIRILRRKANMTLSELAKKIDIKDGPLGRIERGLNAPSAKVIFNLSKVLNVSTDSLFAPNRQKLQKISELESNVPYMTRIGRDKILTRVADKANEVIKYYFRLEELCDARKHCEIPLQVHFYDDDRGVEELANKVRSFLNIHDSIAFDYAELLENYGFRVVNCGFMRDIQSFSYFDAVNGNAFFFINGNNTPERQTFNLITELGLIFMWEKFMKSADVIPDEDALRMAKKFAAFFLMPAPTVLRTVNQLGIKPNQWNWELLLRVKNHFGISSETFLYRLHELDLIEDKPFELLKLRIKKYYDIHRHTEPGKSRRDVVQNARIYDLICAAETKKSREINGILTNLTKLKVYKAQ